MGLMALGEPWGVSMKVVRMGVQEARRGCHRGGLYM